MKFLLDENVFSLLAEKIKKQYRGSVDIYDIGFDGKEDRDIYEFLRQHNYILITFDLDFSDIRKFPPEFVEAIIVLRFKNKTIQEIIKMVSAYLKELKKADFVNSLVIFQNSGIRIKRRLKVLE